jgi:hypothetical protein
MLFCPQSIIKQEPNQRGIREITTVTIRYSDVCPSPKVTAMSTLRFMQDHTKKYDPGRF